MIRLAGPVGRFRDQSKGHFGPCHFQAGSGVLMGALRWRPLKSAGRNILRAPAPVGRPADKCKSAESGRQRIIAGRGGGGKKEQPSRFIDCTGARPLEQSVRRARQPLGRLN